MKTTIKITSLLLLVFVLIGLPNAFPVRAAGPVVNAVLFFSPTCGHCEKVRTQDLPPLVARYKASLNIVEVDVTADEGQAVYQAALAKYAIPDDRVGVPTLIVADTVLVGSQEIPDQFPGLIEKGLKAGGVALPALPGLDQYAPAEAFTVAQETALQAQPGPVGLGAKFSNDLFGNTLAVIVLAVMVLSVFAIAWVYTSESDRLVAWWPKWAIPVLGAIGLGVALYLSYTELSHVAPICGTAKGCETVQNSAYSRLFGFFPVGVLGTLGYIGILAAWIAQYYGPASLRKPAAVALWGMAWFGILFSIYLTFLEPFVIGATCYWCLTSAVVMTLVLWAATGPAKAYLNPPLEDDEEELAPARR